MNEKLVRFLYVLLRDDVPIGRVKPICRDALTEDLKLADLLTDPYLADRAMELAALLTSQ